MKDNKTWKKASVLVLAAIMAGNMPVVSGGERITALAAQPQSPVTEYDEATLALFADNTLEYWEIPGLIERYNPVFLNQLEVYYGNPDGVTGLSRDQLLSMADTLRDEAEELSEELEASEEEWSDKIRQEYEENIRSLKAFASNLEKAAAGEETVDSTMVSMLRQMSGGTRSSTEIVRGLRREKNRLTANVCTQMRNYQVLKAQDDVQKKNLEAAEQSYQSALRQQALGMISAEELQAVESSLNAARVTAKTSEAALTESRQNLILALGWSYDGNPEILAVPEPDLNKIAGYHLAADMETAIGNNYGLIDLRHTDSRALGGAKEKAKQVREMEDSVRMELEMLYRTVLQAETSYKGTMDGWTAAEAAKAQADRKYQLGILSRQEYLQAEAAWLTANATREQASMDLVDAMETYEWAVKGMMPESQM